MIGCNEREWPVDGSASKQPVGCPKERPINVSVLVCETLAPHPICTSKKGKVMLRGQKHHFQGPTITQWQSQEQTPVWWSMNVFLLQPLFTRFLLGVNAYVRPFPWVLLYLLIPSPNRPPCLPSPTVSWAVLTGISTHLAWTGHWTGEVTESTLDGLEARRWGSNSNITKSLLCDLDWHPH